MGELAYSHPQDNLLTTVSTVALTVGVAESTQYDVDRVYDGDPARPLKLVGTSMQLDMAWTSAVLPVFPALLHSNLDVAARLQGDDTDLDTPDIDLPFGIPTMSVGKWFTAPYLDLTGYTAKKLWRLKVTANTLPIILGELWMGSAFRQFSEARLFIDDTRFERAGRTVVHPTGHDVELAYAQAPIRDLTTGTMVVSGSDLTAVLSWMEAAYGRARPFVFVEDDAVDDAQMVRFAADSLSRQPLGGGAYRVSLAWQAVSRGLPWIDPDS
jgi:hypothetical protein